MAFLAQPIHKTHKIGSLEDDMRKILDQNFWSHGTPLGSLGPLSQQDTILGAGQLQILVIWGPYRPPIVVALETQAENLKTAGLQCDTKRGKVL